PNGTQIGTPDNMTFIGGINYNYTWNVNSYEALDNYYFNITAWDTSSNEANETRYFNITSPGDTTDPIINITYYDGYAEYLTGSIEVNVTAYDETLLREVAPVQIIFFYPNGTIIAIYNMTHLSGDIYNYTWSVNSYSPYFNYYFNITVYDNNTNQASAMRYFNITDNINPSININEYDSQADYGTGSIFVNVTATDNHKLRAINPVQLEIYYPNGTLLGIYNMIYQGNDIYEYIWNVDNYWLWNNYYFIVAAYDNSSNSYSTAQTKFNITDTICPNVIIDSYMDEGEYGNGKIELYATITDNHAIQLPINITFYYPNGAVIGIYEMIILGNDEYKFTWSTLGYDHDFNYYFIINASDPSGNLNETETRIFNIVDSVRPSITVNDYNEIVEYGIGDLNLTVTITDNYGLNETNPVVLKIYNSTNDIISQDLNMIHLSGDLYFYSWNPGTTPVGDNYYFKITATDNNTNSRTTNKRSFDIIDTVNPSVIIIYNDDEAAYGTGSIEVNISAYDNYQLNSTNPVQITFYETDGTIIVTDLMILIGPNYTYNWLADPYYQPELNYYFTIIAYDSSENSNTTTQVYFNIIDEIIPIIHGASYESQIAYTNGTLTVICNITDNHEIEYVQILLFEPDDTPIGTFYMNESGDYYSFSWFNPETYNLDIDYYYNITAYDKSGNINNPFWKFFDIIDMGTPNITITYWTTDVEWSTGTFKVNVSIEENYQLDDVLISLYYVNGTVFVINDTMNQWGSDDKEYSYEYFMGGEPLEGGYRFKIFANDTSGNFEDTTYTLFDVVDTVKPWVYNVQPDDTQDDEYPGEIEITVTVTDNYRLRTFDPVEITFYYPGGSILGTYTMNSIGGDNYKYTLSGLNNYAPAATYYFTITAYDSSLNSNTTIAQNFEILDIIIFQDLYTYKDYMLKTTKVRYYQNPSKSNYLIVISPLVAQIAHIEKQLKLGINPNTTLDAYRQSIRDAIAAALDAHPNAYVYIMDSDLYYTYSKSVITRDFNGFLLYAKSNVWARENFYFSYSVLGNPRDYYRYTFQKYQYYIRNKVLQLKTSFYEHTNVLLLGDSLEFPEYWVYSYWGGSYRYYFSDNYYLYYGSQMLGAVGRLPIEQAASYFAEVKNVNFAKIAHIGGYRGSYNWNYYKQYYLFYRQFYLWGKGYSYVYWEPDMQPTTSRLANSDLIITGFNGHMYYGPWYGGMAYNPNNMDPSIMMGYTNAISNTIYYDFSLGTFVSAYGTQAVDNGVSILGSTGDTYVVSYTNYLDSAYIQMYILHEMFRGRYSTLGQVYSAAINYYKYYWFVAEIRLLGDPGLDVSSLDDPGEEVLEDLPENFEAQYWNLDYGINDTGQGEMLYFNITDKYTTPGVTEMIAEQSFASVFGGDLVVPTFVYYLEMNKNQSLVDVKLKLADNVTIPITSPITLDGYLLTENGKVAIPNVNIEEQTTYPKIQIEETELSWKRVYTITVFPAEWKEGQLAFICSRDIKLEFTIENVTLAPNATLSYEEVEFSKLVYSTKNYTLGFNINNLIDSTENATMVNITVLIPFDLTILDCTSGNLTIQELLWWNITWNVGNITYSKYLFIDYLAPDAISDSFERNITIIVEYFSEGGIKYNKYNVTLILKYLKDNLVNLKLDDIVIEDIAQFYVSDTLSIEFIVNNSGHLKISKIQVQVLADGVEIYSYTIASLNPGFYVIFAISTSFTNAGDHDVDIQINAQALGIESNEVDNFYSTTISVLAAPAGPGGVAPAGGGGGGGGGEEEFPFLILSIIIIAIIGCVVIVGVNAVRRRGMVSLKEAKKVAKKEIDKETGIEVEPKKLVCIVHRGPVAGGVYICPNCQSIFCEKCALALKKKGENCWTCDHEITIPGAKKISKEKTIVKEKDNMKKKKIVATVIPDGEHKKKTKQKDAKSSKADEQEKSQTKESKFRIRAKLKDKTPEKEDNGR
ncbi:MAG: hypothetical protein EU529_13285, partial [Promethearchaeota archaeon]